MSTQRKLVHLLKSSGDGVSFRYLPELNIALDLSKPILITEKVDGSTMQSKGGEPWKRCDLFAKGDPAKRVVSMEERYGIKLCSVTDPSMKWYMASFNAFREEFEEFGRRYPERWIYFEALGEKIGARYRGLQPTVRVFDIGEDGRFLPFPEAVKAAQDVGLPVVAHRYEVFGDIDNLLKILSDDVSRDDGFPPHSLEGWVLRQMIDSGEGGVEMVAKVRVADLKKTLM